LLPRPSAFDMSSTNREFPNFQTPAVIFSRE
jgi:hypothetical protein